MSEAAALASRIAELFTRQIHVEVPSPNTDLFEAGILDSMAFVEVVTLLEQEFGIKVSLEDLEIENFRSIAKIAAFAAAKSKNGFKVAI
jgi:acyl carrier protein